MGKTRALQNLVQERPDHPLPMLQILGSICEILYLVRDLLEILRQRHPSLHGHEDIQTVCNIEGIWNFQVKIWLRLYLKYNRTKIISAFNSDSENPDAPLSQTQHELVFKNQPPLSGGVAKRELLGKSKKKITSISNMPRNYSESAQVKRLRLMAQHHLDRAHRAITKAGAALPASVVSSCSSHKH